MTDPFILVRAVHLAATLLAAGTVFFTVQVADPALRGSAGAAADLLCRRLRGIVWGALAVALPSGAAWLVLLSAAIHDTTAFEAVTGGGLWSVATETRFGLVSLLRLTLGLLLGAALLWPAERWLHLTAAGPLAALIALTGHAGAGSGVAGAVHLGADIVHLVAAAAWLGALPGLILLLMTARRIDDARWRAVAVQATARFSALGLFCVAALLASGTASAFFLLDGPRDLIDTGYGRLLALKIALFAGMVSIAAVNRFHLTPRLPRPRSTGALIRNSLAETVLGMGIVIIVGMLGTMVPGRHAAHQTGTALPEGASFVHLHMTKMMADVTIDPGRAGRVRAILRIMDEQGGDLPVSGVGLALDPPNANALSPARNATRRPDGTWTVEGIDLASPGVWTLRVIVATDTGEPTVLDGPVVIER